MNTIDRNAPCPCGAEKTYEQCCMQTAQQTADYAEQQLTELDEAFDAGLALHQEGRFAEAEAIYRRIIDSDPEHAPALYLLGVLAYQAGQYLQAEQLIDKVITLEPNDPAALHLLGVIANLQGQHARAVELISRSLQINPQFVEAYGNLGAALQAQGDSAAAIHYYRQAVALAPQDCNLHQSLGIALQQLNALDEAIASYRNALALQPDDAEAHNRLGTALHAQNKLPEAIDSYRRGILLQPHQAVIHNNLALALLAQNKLTDAAAAFQQVLKLKPDHVEALNNLGTIYKAQGQVEDALHSYRAALGINPEYAPAYSNLGSLLQSQGKFAEALLNHRRACALKPHDAGLYNNLGLALQAQGDLDEAITWYRQALALKPDMVEIYINLGAALQSQEQLDAAAALYRQAIQLKPELTVAHSNLGNILQAQCRFAEAIASYQQGLRCNPHDSDSYSNLLMAKQYDPAYSQQQLLTDHSHFAERFETPLRAQWQPHPNSRDPMRRLNIGFVSGDLCEHPVGVFLENTLAHIDRSALDITLYSTRARVDTLTQRLQAMAFNWESLIGINDAQAAQQIRARPIDILIDLSGHTGHNRLPLFARKPAPIQIGWLGYWATTALHAMDYILCDPHCVFADETNHFVEQPWLLPDTRLCFTPPPHTVAINTLPALSAGYVTLGCFNNLAKLNDQVIALWARVLQRLGNARLLLKARQLNEASTRAATAARFAAHGIGAERLLLEGPSPRAEYFAAYNRVDIALDPFPFTGATTSIEGLWMGVPFVTLRGDRMLSRQGESILRNVQLQDWIAADVDDYVDKLALFAADLQMLAALRMQLRARLLASPLCDAPRFAKNLESALRAMWQRYCAAAPAKNLS